MKIASSKRGLESDLDDWRDEVGVDVRSKGGQGKGTTVCAPAWIPGYFLETGGICLQNFRPDKSRSP